MDDEINVHIHNRILFNYKGKIEIMDLQENGGNWKIVSEAQEGLPLHVPTHMQIMLLIFMYAYLHGNRGECRGKKLERTPLTEEGMKL